MRWSPRQPAEAGGPHVCAHVRDAFLHCCHSFSGTMRSPGTTTGRQSSLGRAWPTLRPVSGLRTFIVRFHVRTPLYNSLRSISRIDDGHRDATSPNQVGATKIQRFGRHLQSEISDVLRSSGTYIAVASGVIQSVPFAPPRWKTLTPPLTPCAAALWGAAEDLHDHLFG